MWKLVLVGLKMVTIALLYSFLYQVVRVVRKDMVGVVSSEGKPVQQPAESPVGKPVEKPSPAKAKEIGPGDRPELVVVGENGALERGTCIPLVGEVTVGRSLDNSIVLKDPYVSNMHARFVRKGTRFWVEDMGSKNGTLINNRRVRGRLPLRPGDMIVIGDSIFEFRE